MISGLGKFLFVLICVELCGIFGIQVPTYPERYSDKQSNLLKPLRKASSGHRLSSGKFKKSTNSVPLAPYRQEINYNSQSPFSDAIRIVDPPNFFQDQKKYYQKSYGDTNISKNPVSLAAPWMQLPFRGTENRPSTSALKQKKPPHKYAEHRPEYGYSPATLQQQDAGYKNSGHRPSNYPGKHYKPFYETHEYRPPPFSVKNHPQQQHKNIKFRPEVSLQKEVEVHNTAEDYELANSSPKHVSSYQSVDIEHQKATPSYLGIQTPNSNTIRGQLSNFKERQKNYFEDELDEFPTRPEKVKKYKTTKLAVNPENSPSAFGHDIYNEEEEHFENLKDKYFGAKVHASAGTTTSRPDESKKEPPLFVPYRMLASVRHTNRVNHKPRDTSNPRAKARLRTEQAYTVHSEQGFEDNNHNHNDEERNVNRKRKIRSRRNIPSTDHLNIASTKKIRTRRSPQRLNPKEHISIKKIQTVYSEQGYEDHAYDNGDEDRRANYRKKYRPRRNAQTTNSDSELIEQVEELPVALRLVGPSGERLSGDALIRHITQLLKNSSKYLSEDSTDISRDVASVIIPPEELEGLLQKSSTDKIPHHFSHQHLDTSSIPQSSAIKYAEKFGNFDESPYEKDSTVDCNEDSEYDFEQNRNKKKLGNLGKKLDCFKDKYFGRDPFDNPLFQEDVISPGYPTLKSDIQNPSSLVYDDVMKTIQNSLHSERHLALVPIPENAAQTGIVDTRKFESYTQTSTVAPRAVYKEIYSSLPVFDITKYFPKVYMIRPNGKIYSIKFRPKQPPAPSVMGQHVEIKRKNKQNVSRIEKKKTSANRETTPRIVEPRNVYKFSQEDAVRSPRNYYRFRTPA